MITRRVLVGTLLTSAGLAAVASRAGGAQQRRPRRRILVLDVIETMLDVQALEPHFVRAFGDGQVLKEWFANLLLYANVTTVAGPYSDFGTVAGVGRVLLGDFLFPFEAVSILLLIAVVGALVVAQRHHDTDRVEP